MEIYWMGIRVSQVPGFVSLLRLRSMDDDMVCPAITVGSIVAEARHNTKIALILRVSRETCFL